MSAAANAFTRQGKGPAMLAAACSLHRKPHGTDRPCNLITLVRLARSWRPRGMNRLLASVIGVEAHIQHAFLHIQAVLRPAHVWPQQFRHQGLRMVGRRVQGAITTAIGGLE